MRSIRKKIKDTTRHIIFLRDKKRLINKDFTIISNNCWGGNVSRDFNIQHHSPFVGMFIFSEDYLKLVSNLEYYLSKDLKFIEVSKYEHINERRKKENYPLALLGDIELHMQHYKTKEEAYEKWNRRKERINWDNIYVKISEKFRCTPEILEKFDRLPYKNKIILTEKSYPNLKNAVQLKKFDLDNEMLHYRRYFNIVEWLNTGKIVKK